MAIVDVTEIWSGETWEDEAEGNRTYERLFRVYSDTPTETQLAVKTAVGIPPLGSAYPTDVTAFARRRSARRIDESRLVWEVTVAYDNSKPDPNPLLQPPKIRWSSSLVTQPVVRDLTGKACLNSAGDYFDPPLEADFPRWTATIQFNTDFVPTWILSYSGAINSSPISIDGVAVDALHARIVSLEIGEVQEENEVSFRQVTVGIECRRVGDQVFDLQPLDQGFREKVEDELKDILIEDAEGNLQRPTAPVLLDGNGRMLSNPTPDNAVFLEFPICPRLNFAVFPGIT
jgi:hypothetical protein